MNYLVLDTSTDGAAVGAWSEVGEIVTATIDVPRRHGRDLVPLLLATMKQAGMRPADLDVVAVGLGPGSFTGLRIGLAAAKTLAYVVGTAILGIDSLEAVAANAPAEVLSVSAIADAQRGELFTADFARATPGGPLVRNTPTRIESLTAWRARIEPGTFVIGPGLDSPRIRPSLPESIVAADAGLNRPTAAGLVGLAVLAWEQGRRDDLWTIEPHYLRRSAAEEKAAPAISSPSPDRRQTS